jgi:hypothetical protein
MSGAVRGYVAAFVSLARRGLPLALICGLGGCVTDPVSTLTPPPPYMLLPADEMMSCAAITASFRFAARRAALLEYWMSVGRLQTYERDKFPEEVRIELVDERRRLDALSELQRDKGCHVSEPGPAVVEERSKLGVSVKQLPAPVVLNSKG